MASPQEAQERLMAPLVAAQEQLAAGIYNGKWLALGRQGILGADPSLATLHAGLPEPSGDDGPAFIFIPKDPQAALIPNYYQ